MSNPSKQARSNRCLSDDMGGVGIQGPSTMEWAVGLYEDWHIKLGSWYNIWRDVDGHNYQGWLRPEIITDSRLKRKEVGFAASFEARVLL